MKSITIKRRFHIALLAVGSLFTLAGSAAAETPVKAKVPFDFIIGSITLSAGDYTVEQISTNTREMLVVRDSNGTARAVINGVRTERTGDPRDPRLVFNKYERGAVLAQVWLSATEAGVSVPQTHLERELMLGSAGKAETIAVVSGK